MDYFSIDHFILGAFLLITLVVGLWAGRGIKDIREYALANKMFGTGALILTWLATDVAGETVLDMAGSVRTEGILQPLVVLGGWGIALLMQALCFAPRFIHFNNCITMGDIMGQLYKGPSQVMTGILSFFTALCIAGMELTVLGILSETLLGIDYRWGVGIGGLILVGYTAHGGIKAVILTDVFQFLVLLVVVPIVAVTALQKAEGIGHVFMQVPATQFQVLNHPKASCYLTLFLSLSVFQFSVIDPALVQRLLMGKTKQQLRHQFFIVAVFLFALLLTLLLLGLASIVLYPDATDVPIVLRIIGDLLPVGLKGLAMAGLFAITMSTFDSFLHAAGLTLIHDVISPLYNRISSPLNELRWVRYMTVLVGFVVIAVGLIRADDLYSFVLLSYKFTGPLLAFPLFAGVLGLKPDKHAFYIASGVTIGVLLLAEFLLPEAQSHWVPLISVVTNGIVFLGIHIIRNNGFAIINRTQEEETQKKEYSWKPRRESILTQFKQLLPTPYRIVKYSQEQVQKYGAPYTLLGIFCIVNYIVPYFMWDHNTPQAYDLMLYLRLIGAMAGGLLVCKEKWPQSLLPYMPTFWHLTLLYGIPFTGTVMFLLTQGSVEWLINVAITIMFLIVLVDWMSFLLLTVLGIALGFLFYTQVVGPINIHLDFSTGYLLAYQCVCATLIGLLFARRKQARFDTVATDNKRLDTIYRETIGELLASLKEKANLVKAFRKSGAPNLNNLTSLSKEIGKALVGSNVPQSVINQHEQLTKQLTSMAVQLDRLDHRATGYLRLEVDTIALADLLGELQEKLQAQGLAEGIQFYKVTQHQEVQCDLGRVKTLLANGISFLRRSRGEEAPILVGIEDTQLGYPLPSVKKDYIKKIAALRFAITTAQELPQVAQYYPAQLNDANTPMPEGVQDLLLATNRRIVSAHYGHEKIAMQASNITLLYVLPVQLREVRPKDMDIAQMELGADLVRADDTYPGAQEQEKAFLAAVQQRTQADIAAVKTALEMIKWYHGPVKRKSGEPFYLHPLAVAHIVLDYNQDEATILGALLHDTVEDTPMLLENVEIMFGKEVAGIVDGVTHLESHKESFYKVKLSSQENILMLLEVADQRALYVKLADRMHNMRTIQYKPYKSQRKTTEETLQFFVPLAEKLGLQKAAAELKELCRAVLHSPDR